MKTGDEMKEPYLDTQNELIELLAEDELTLAQTKALFRQLDQSEAGWKACAIALLESRKLKRSLRGFHSLQKPDVVHAKNVSDQPTKENSQSSPAWPILAVVGALLLVSGFFAGTHASTPSNQSGKKSERVAFKPSAFLHASIQKIQPEFSDVRLDAIGVPDARIIAFLGTRENQKPRVYPVIESEELTKQLINVESPRLPQATKNKLARQGWKVTRQKQLVAVQQEDGSRKTYPIEMLNYEFVGQETY